MILPDLFLCFDIKKLCSFYRERTIIPICWYLGNLKKTYLIFCCRSPKISCRCLNADIGMFKERLPMLEQVAKIQPSACSNMGSRSLNGVFDEYVRLYAPAFTAIIFIGDDSFPGLIKSLNRFKLEVDLMF